MTDPKKFKRGTYKDKYGQTYIVEKKNGDYVVWNKEGRMIKIDDINSFMKEVIRIGSLENLVE